MFTDPTLKCSILYIYRNLCVEFLAMVCYRSYHFLHIFVWHYFIRSSLLLGSPKYGHVRECFLANKFIGNVQLLIVQGTTGRSLHDLHNGGLRLTEETKRFSCYAAARLNVGDCLVAVASVFWSWTTEI